ncbi:MAG: hypothetical protein AAB397_02500, partial [Patescibacteria group bacterium]
AAAQAQFDLAQKAYKYPAENSAINNNEEGMIISNGAGYKFENDEYITKFYTPTLEENEQKIVELPAPWEDAYKYAELPKEYFEDLKGEYPKEIGKDYYLNRWYKDINQMYLPQNETSTFSRILKEWFCLEKKDEQGKVKLDMTCYDGRNPKYNEP